MRIQYKRSFWLTFVSPLIGYALLFVPITGKDPSGVFALTIIAFLYISCLIVVSAILGVTGIALCIRARSRNENILPLVIATCVGASLFLWVVASYLFVGIPAPGAMTPWGGA
jgi:hypothetical protein